MQFLTFTRHNVMWDRCLCFQQTNIVMQYDMAGKDKRFVSNPEQLQPERWLRQSSEKTSAYLTLPFGFGPRSCPGRRLAAQEVAIAIVKVDN